ncbi:ABC-type branched-subunit amino acid transport system substrate-binding protein [Variovorax boronicumulans]|uniref:ABC transporter substrate-binding protein n=1 Tax=Variovorax boronicumulans TaxID=436515 RepID=UPI00159D2C31|nr:ABC transporter substrate-binding protein [Variovorax boronicumulans]MDQ0015352.1 ABC-type branched-subunit amino acid transport system substrate-binding protein [Variovorax boronicumulans]
MTVPEQRVFLAPPTTSRRRVLTGLAATAAAGLGMPAFAQGKPIRIGTTFDNSSVEKANGQGLFQGSSAFFNALNKSGGLNGTKVELVMADDTFKPEVAKANALAFEKDSSVLALLHPLGTRQTSEVMDAVPGMAVVGPITGTVALRKKTAPNTFWVRVNYDQEVEKLVTTAAVLGQSRIGLVHSNDPLGQSVLAAFKAALAKAKLEPAVIATTPNTTSMEVGPAAEAIAKAKPQVVIIGLAGTAPVFMKALRDAGGNSSAYGLSITASALSAMGDLARGLGFVIVVPSPYSTKFEIVRRYQADMVANGTKDFSLTSLEGYINAAVLAEGLRRAGGSPTRASVMAGMASIENFDLGGMKLHYGRTNREGGQFVDVAVIGSRGQMLS